MGAFLRTKFEVYSIILTSFSQRDYFTSSPTPKRLTPKKPTQTTVSYSSHSHIMNVLTDH